MCKVACSLLRAELPPSALKHLLCGMRAQTAAALAQATASSIDAKRRQRGLVLMRGPCITSLAVSPTPTTRQSVPCATELLHSQHLNSSTKNHCSARVNATIHKSSRRPGGTSVATAEFQMYPGASHLLPTSSMPAADTQYLAGCRALFMFIDQFIGTPLAMCCAKYWKGVEFQ